MLHLLFPIGKNCRVEETRIREKHHRLHESAYQNGSAVIITACIQDRKPAFSSISNIEMTLDSLRSATNLENCRCTLYVFMPDHLHLILRAREESSSPMRCMKRFKQQSGFRLAKVGFKWQKDFYDRIVRGEKELVNQVRYIVGNPVRAGLVEYPLDWPHTGSLEYSIEELLLDL